MARQLDARFLAMPRSDPRWVAWMEAADGAQIAGRWLAGHPSEALGMVCSSAEFTEALVSYLGVDSPAASAPGVEGVLGAAFSGYSGRRTDGGALWWIRVHENMKTSTGRKRRKWFCRFH